MSTGAVASRSDEERGRSTAQPDGAERQVALRGEVHKNMSRNDVASHDSVNLRALPTQPAGELCGCLCGQAVRTLPVAARAKRAGCLRSASRGGSIAEAGGTRQKTRVRKNPNLFDLIFLTHDFPDNRTGPTGRFYAVSDEALTLPAVVILPQKICS